MAYFFFKNRGRMGVLLLETLGWGHLYTHDLLTSRVLLPYQSFDYCFLRFSKTQQRVLPLNIARVAKCLRGGCALLEL